MAKLIRAVIAIAAVLVLFVGALALTAYLGMVNVAATSGYMPGAEWFFGTLSERSIARHAASAVDSGEIVVPELTDEMASSGSSEYVEMCVACHGGPGVQRGEYGRGLKPEPPDLAHEAREMSAAELFWVVKHGVRHTGMPAFGPTHSDEEMWAVVAFVEQLADMSPEQYRERTAGAAESHRHEDGGH